MRSKTAATRFDEIMMPPLLEMAAYADKLEQQGNSIIRSTGQGVPFTKPPGYALQALTDIVLTDVSIHSYSPDPGFQEVREAVSSYLYNDFSIRAFSENIILTAGSNMAFFMLITALLEPGYDEVLLLSPYYFNHLMAVQMAGGKPIIARSSQGFELDPSVIVSNVSDRTRAIVTVSPNNPSGAVFSRGSFEELSEIFEERNDIVLISDEPYSNFVYNQYQHWSPAALPSLKDSTCMLGSCSKTFGIAGWRLGWLHLPPGLDKLHNTLLKIQDTTNIAPPTISQKFFLAILQGPYKKYLISTKKLLERNWRFVMEWMGSLDSNIGIEFPQKPQGAFYLFPKIVRCKDSISFCKELLEETGVVTVPGIAFGEEGFFRISYAGAIEEVEEAFMRFENFMRGRRTRE